MKLLVLGATGRTGRELVKHALAAGHEVAALVRNPDAITTRNPALTIITGSPENMSDVDQAMAGCAAVLVALNNNRSSDAPWAKPVSPPRLIETSVWNAVAAMASHDIRRILILSAAGVGDSFAAAPWLMRVLIRKTNLAHTYRDHEAVDAYIRATDIDWTLVRAVGLSNSETDRRLVVSDGHHPRPGMTISRSRVARFMLDGLEDSSLYRQSPVVSER